jgi:8-oxo-dGTP pyrophosphatase MutT (NUDIX family)
MRYRGQSLLLFTADNELLLQFRDGAAGIRNPLAWDFFGGAYEPGEDVLVGALRELSEELNIAADASELTIVGDYADANGREVVIRLTRPVSWNDIELHEGAGCGFFTKEEALNLPLEARVRVIIEKYA